MPGDSYQCLSGLLESHAGNAWKADQAVRSDMSRTRPRENAHSSVRGQVFPRCLVIVNVSIPSLSGRCIIQRLSSLAAFVAAFVLPPSLGETRSRLTITGSDKNESPPQGRLGFPLLPAWNDRSQVQSNGPLHYENWSI